MPKISIYVPDAMYDQLRRRELPISQLAQRAFSSALTQAANAAWIARARERLGGPTSVPTEALMEDVDAEFGA